MLPDIRGGGKCISVSQPVSLWLRYITLVKEAELEVQIGRRLYKVHWKTSEICHRPSFNPFLHKFLFMSENLGIFFSAFIKVKESFFDQ